MTLLGSLVEATPRSQGKGAGAGVFRTLCLGVPSPHRRAPCQGDIAAFWPCSRKELHSGGGALSEWQEPRRGGLAFSIRLALPRAAPLPPRLSPRQQVRQLSLRLQGHFKDLPRGPQLGRGPEWGLPYCQESPLLVFLRLGDIISTQQSPQGLESPKVLVTALRQPEPSSSGASRNRVEFLDARPGHCHTSGMLHKPPRLGFVVEEATVVPRHAHVLITVVTSPGRGPFYPSDLSYCGHQGGQDWQSQRPRERVTLLCPRTG